MTTCDSQDNAYDQALETVGEKVIAIFRQLVDDPAQKLEGLNQEARDIMAEALADEYGSKQAQRLSLQMLDWNSDAAFVTAFHLFPERFTAGEIRAGVGRFLCHAPNHIREACRITGQYVWENFPYDDDNDQEANS